MLDYSPNLLAKAHNAIASWQSKLLDLSKANRLLRFRDTKLSTVPVVEPDIPALFDLLVLHDAPVPIVSSYPEESDNQSDLLSETVESDSITMQSRFKTALISSYKPDHLRSALYNLRQKAHASIEERGVNVLHIAIGFLVWNDPQEKTDQWRAPLVLAPVTIDRAGPDKYTLAALEEDVVLNPTLVYKLDHDFGLKLPELPDDLERLEGYLADVQQVVRSLPGANVESLAFLGLFSFTKIPMYQDLARCGEEILKHPIIAQLAGLPAPVPEPTAESLLGNDLDEQIDPRSTFQVLDADSSQQEALLAARRGANLVIQGPPGTGKSQTIANLIAESLMDSKRVLFVSEKAAALEVVKRRLDGCGLGDACLELHSHQADKKKILAELERTLNAPQPALPAQANAPLETLVRRRDELNTYVRELHRPRFAWKQTAYQVHGLLASIRHVPHVNFSVQQVVEMTEGDLHKHRARLEALVSHVAVINQLSAHPWCGLHARPPSFAYRSELRGHLENLQRLGKELERNLEVARSATELNWPDDFRQLEGISQFLGKYRADILSLPAGEWCQRFERDYAAWTRFLNPKYWSDFNYLKSLCRAGWTWRYTALRVDLRRLEMVRAVLTVPERAVPGDDQIWSQVSVLKPFLNLVLLEIEYFRKQFEPNVFDAIGLEQSVSKLTTWCDEHLKGLDRVDEYLTYLHDRDQAIADGLGSFLDAAATAGVPAQIWPEIYLRGVYEAWLDEAGHDAPVLAYFSSEAHNKLIAQFRKLDLLQLRLAQQAIIAKLVSVRPRLTALVQHASSAEINILVHEFRKQRRIKPLRKLFREAPHVIQALKPCFMMSPLTVSQFLEPNNFDFDLVIFDEASQVKVEDAVGCIFRGRQLVVAGDSKQLPPTRFFDVLTTDDDWDEESEDESDVYESILDALDAMRTVVLNRMLLWHYRSRHEALIAFSNKNFYDNRLYTFPHPGQVGADRGIEFVYVPDGIYERGGARKNVVEARRVVEIIFEHVQKHPDWSLAVVTFSDAQRDAIQRELDRQLPQRLDVQWFFDDKNNEPFRIKNLELIQGDERDAIIFSVGYGRDEAGKPPALSFGPLNKAGGRRRLNVAVTRARHHVTVVSSMQPEELARSDNEGVRLFREYMLLARDGLGALLDTVQTGTVGEIESPFEASVYKRLATEGLEVHPQVGCSGYRIDLAVVDPKLPGRYCLGIECDGATYHSARTARDRDRLRQQVLENLGWHIHRIWSRDWNVDPEREVRQVLSLVKQYAGQEKADPQTNPKSVTTSEHTELDTQTFALTAPITSSVTSSSQQGLPNGVIYYKRYDGRVRSWNGTPPHLIADDIAQIVNFEGPIHVEGLVRTIAKAWEIGRVGKRVREAILAGLNVAQRQRMIRLMEHGSFAWPMNVHSIDNVRVPCPGDEPRSMNEICPEEIKLAIKLCLKEAGGGLSKPDVVGLVVRLFGYQRATDKVAQPVHTVLDQMLQANELAIVDGIVRTAEQPLRSIGQRG